MTERLRNLRYTPLLVLFALWSVVFYQLTFVAWTIEYSYYGVGLVIAASLLFVYAFPRADRRIVVRFTLFCLMAGYGLASFVSSPPLWKAIDYLVFFVFAMGLGIWLVGLRKLQLFIVLAVLALFEVWVPLSDVSVLSEFDIRYVGHMTSPDPQLTSIPAVPIPDPAHPGQMEILTLRGHRPVKGEAQMLINLLANPKYSQSAREAIRQLQYSYDVLAVRPGKLRFVTHYASAREMAQAPFWSLGLVDFPFTTAHFLSLKNQTRMYVSLSQSPGSLLSALLSPGTLADQIGNLSLKTAAATARNWAQVTGRTSNAVDGLVIRNGRLTGVYDGRPIRVATAGVAVLGVYPMLPASVSPVPQAVVEGNNLIQVIGLGPGQEKVLATLRGSYSHPLTTDIVFADLSGNHHEAMLINTVPAQIVQLSPHGHSWKTLWTSGRSSFRFETVIKRAGGDLIVANSPSLVSYSPIRYLGGYLYSNHQLTQVFRVYHGNLVNLHTVTLKPGGRQDLLSSVYANQEILLLAPSRIPWIPVVDAVFLLLVLTGVARRFRVRGEAR